MSSKKGRRVHLDSKTLVGWFKNYILKVCYDGAIYAVWNTLCATKIFAKNLKKDLPLKS